MGNRGSRQQHAAGTHATGAGQTLHEGTHYAHADAELIKFLATQTGSKWLADILLEFPGHVEKLRSASLAEVNHFVIKKYKEFTSSDIGRRMIWAPQQRAAVQQDTLMVPVYIIEDFVRQRLKTKITRNWWSIGWFLATRTPFMCAAVYATKHLIKKHLLQPRARGRHKRVVRVATFVLDELVPTSFYGPLLTYGLLAHKMVQELEDS